MSEPSYEEARDAVRARLSEEEAAHCERVADFAAELAGLHGVEAAEARLAGILHDWDKEASCEELLAEAERLGVQVTEADRQAPYLLHAPVSAAHVREAFPSVSQGVTRAIERHTVGAADMSPLDVIVFVADSLEPGRRHEGLEELRAEALTQTLAQTFRMTYTRSVRRLVEWEMVIHPTTVIVWNSFVAET